MDGWEASRKDPHGLMRWFRDPEVDVEEKVRLIKALHVEGGLDATGGDAQRAARVTGTPQATFYRMLKIYKQLAVRKQLLLIDDEPKMLAALERPLRQYCDVTTSANLKDARDVLRTARFDGVLCDYRLGRDRGTELYRWICERDLPVAQHFVLYTGGIPPRFPPVAIVDKGENVQVYLSALWPRCYTNRPRKK